MREESRSTLSLRRDRVRLARREVRSYERALFGRQLVVTLLPAACYLLRYRSDSARALLVLALAATVLNFIYYVLLVRGRFPAACRWARLVLDICLWTLLMHYTGGPASLFYVGYVAEILLSAIAVSPAGCLVAGALSAIGFAVLIGLHPLSLSWEHDLSRFLGLVLVGVLGWTLVRRLETRSRRIESLNRDLTAQAERILSEAAELRSRLVRARVLEGAGGEGLAATLHEIRNTVHGLGGLLSLLKADLSEDQRCADRVALIESGVRNMHRMAEELLSLSSDEARAQTSLAVPDILREAITFATRGKIPEGIAIDLHEDRPLPLALANDEALRGAFVNLIRNALQAMPTGGRLDIRCHAEEPDRVVIEVSDTGPGVPAAIRGRLFEPFVTGRKDGIGLGLAISRRVVEAGGGSLTLGTPGETGTTMIVRLPAASVSGVAQQSPTPFDKPLAESASRP